MTAASPAQHPDNYHNPVLAGFHPDPSVVRVGDRFYLVTSSFEYFPGIPIFESTDLVSWHQIGFCLPTSEHLDLRGVPASGGVFAPTIRWHEGTFFVTATNVSGSGHLITTATDPGGPWTPPVGVDQDGIDPSLYFDAEGHAHFHSTVEPDPSGPHELNPPFTRGIQQSVIDPVSGAVLKPAQFLWSGSGGRFPEAPHVYRRGDWYYLLIAEGGTEAGHMVTVARSRDVNGPYEGCPRNPVLSHRSAPSGIRNTGHADLVELADGSWWAVLLATRPRGNWHHLGRETFLVPVTWDDDEWPVIGATGAVLPEHRRPPLPVEHEHLFSVLGPEGLPVEWNSLRTPLREHLTVGPEEGSLTLRGRPDGTSDPHLVAVLRRQQHFTMTTSAHLVRTTGAGEAGLLVRLDERHHAELAVVSDGRRQLVLRRRIGDLVVEDVVSRVDHSSVHLSVSSDGDTYRFSWSTESEPGCVSPPTMEARYLSSEVAGGFTGVYVGFYASGSEHEVAFDDILYRSTETGAAASGLLNE